MFMNQSNMGKPFFAQFLEAQNKTESQTQAGFPVPTKPMLDFPGGDTTQKFPSDWDDED
jgi:hypothetical protein